MLKSWQEVEKRYNELKPTSRAAQNLKVWGEIFASAYKLDPNRADELWQNLVEINISTDIAYAKYFVAQIFNKITEYLHIADAIDLLYMNKSRVNLIVMHGYEGWANQSWIIKNLLIRHFINEKYDLITEVLELECKRNSNSAEFYNHEESCNKLVSPLAELIKPNDFSVFKGKAEFNNFREKYCDNLAQMHKMFEMHYPKSRLSRLVYVLSIINSDKIVENAEYVTLLLRLCMPLHCSKVFWTFLYHEREILPPSVTKSFIIDYCKENHSLPMSYDEKSTKEEKAQAKWYRAFWENDEEIADSILLRTYGRLDDDECEYLDDLLVKKQFERWLMLLSSMILKGNENYEESCLEYVIDTFSELLDEKEEHTNDYGWFSITTHFGKESQLADIRDELNQNINFALAAVLLCYATRITNVSSEFCRYTIMLVNNNAKMEQLLLKIKKIYNLVDENDGIYKLGELLLDEMPEEKKKIEELIEEKKQILAEEQARKEDIELYYKEIREERELDLYGSLEESSPYKIRSSSFLKDSKNMQHFKGVMHIIVNEIDQFLKEKNIDIRDYICNDNHGVRSVYLTDKYGDIIRNTSMMVPLNDEDLSKFIIKHTEGMLRKKMKYNSIKLPEIPHENIVAKYYSFPNGSKGYYRCINEDEQPALIKHGRDMYEHIQDIIIKNVDEYCKLNNLEVETVEVENSADKRTLIDDIMDVVKAETVPEITFNEIISLYNNTTASNKKQKCKAVASIAWDYWMLHSENIQDVDYKYFVDTFVNKKWDLHEKYAVLSGEYQNAIDYFVKYQSVYSTDFTDKDRDRIKNCIVVTLHAVALLCQKVKIDFAELFLGEWKTQQWEVFSTEEYTNIDIPRIRVNVGNVIIYDTKDTPIIETYETSDAQIELIKYVMKLISNIYCEVHELPVKHENIDSIDDLFKHDNYSEFLEYLPEVITLATTYTATSEETIYYGNCIEFVTLNPIERESITWVGKMTSSQIDDIVKLSYLEVFGTEFTKAMPVQKRYEYFTINYETETLADYFEENIVSDEVFVQEQYKQLVNYFYDTYDTYCEHMEKILDHPVVYDPSFSYAGSKLKKDGKGFIGKDLYQLPLIAEDGRDFIQWIARIKKGTIIYPEFKPYIPILFYYIINGGLFSDRREMGLLVMCKMWNYYFEKFQKNDRDLLIGWIKDYWMIYCPEIPLKDFKRLFNRRVIFVNEPTIDVLNDAAVLDYYNEVCFYKVLHGKLVKEGQREVFETAIKKINTSISELWNSRGLSYQDMLYKAAGRNTYTFMRAVITKDNLHRIYTETGERIISTIENYVLAENETTLRLQWEFKDPYYDTEFIKAFMEYTLKLTEYWLRKWFGYSISNSFNVDASSIYKYKQKNPIVQEILEDNKKNNQIEKIIYDTVVDVCTSYNIPRKGNVEEFAVFLNKDILIIEDELDYEGIDPAQRVTRSALEEARKTLLKNQSKLVIEDEFVEETIDSKEGDDATFNEIEKALLCILLYSDDVQMELQNLVLQKIIPSVIINKINEKAMDVLGDVVIDESQNPPEIYEEYIDFCKEVTGIDE